MACADILHFLLSAGHALQFFQHGWVGFLESRADSFLDVVHLIFLDVTQRKFCVDAEIHPKDFFAMLRAIARISSVWLRSYGLQQ